MERDNSGDKNGNGNEEEREEKDRRMDEDIENVSGAKGEEIQRITVSKEVQSFLARALERVNDGFTGGRVNKTQMANWIIRKFVENLSDADIREVRAEHFDEITVLENILRNAKETKIIPAELKSLLQKQFGWEETSKRKRS